MTIKLEGIYTALITPFQNNEVDYSSLKKLVKQQVDGGVQGFVVNGTTAESPNLSSLEVEKIFQFIKTEVAGQIKLILGTGSNSTANTIEQSQKAKKLGAEACLVVVPYYNKPPQEGLYQHFSAIAKSTDIPFILYNVPSRTVTSMSPEIVIRLSQIDNIVAIKEASGDMKVANTLIQEAKKGFQVLSGDDGTYLDLVGLGGKGNISVLSHVLPKLCVAWFETAKTDAAKAKQAYAKYDKLTSLLFKEANPIPVKYVMQRLGVIQTSDMRLPLIPCSTGLQKELDQELKALGLI